ncbi:hypothetical protein BU26DRAFT_416412 [Trematosphaeria pertusa]|uniref:Uncharacterized protein n=1 Tax=Trematosphaeria pertusa TaxID=390896 RepID=A0A6A6J057_9PLEO|nr:uncharacterized protein BU26DRAFT_416412 [Trematosphaeria pertusa]KAF2254783.1 hypothetical protein BU26DRAFT_416412 [Trematosphaeria pertusa]
MCLGNSTRVSQGGSIAVLRPTRHLEQADTNAHMLLLFSNRTEALIGCAGIQVEFQGWEGKSSVRRDRCWVVIHHDGDLSASEALPPNALPQKPLFSFSLDAASTQTMQLPQRLELGVGDAGLIGRRVSLMTSSRQGPVTLAEGIMGWN